MTLNNYWWMLIWLAAAGIFLQFAVPGKNICVLGKTEYRWRWPAVFCVVCPYVLWCMGRRNFGDTEVYRQAFYEVPASMEKLQAYFADHTKDKGFSLLTAALKIMIGDNDKLFFLILAMLQILCVAYFFRKYSDDFLLCMFMFLASTDYLSWMFNGMRQFTAVCIILPAFSLTLEKKYVSAVGVILLASTIHGSALLMLPMIFVIQGKAWNKRTLLMIFSIGIVILFAGKFTFILDSILEETQYRGMVESEIWINDDGTNLLRVLFYSIPMILSLLGRKYVEKENSPVVNLCVNCSICTSGIYALSAASSGIYLGRIPIYTTLPGYVACVWLIEHMFTKRSAELVKSVLVGVFLVFFYYQMHVAWGIL